eukprot:g2769.t1
MTSRIRRLQTGSSNRSSTPSLFKRSQRQRPSSAVFTSPSRGIRSRRRSSGTGNRIRPKSSGRRRPSSSSSRRQSDISSTVDNFKRSIRSRYQGKDKFGQVFRNWDENKDGVVSEGEFGDILKLCGFKLPREKVSQIFQHFDTDNSKAFDYEEFVEMIFDEKEGQELGDASVPLSKQEQLRRRLKDFGVDIDKQRQEEKRAQRRTSVKNMDNIIKSLRNKFQASSLVQAFRHMDTDDDASVSKDELKGMISRLGYNIDDNLMDDLFIRFDESAKEKGRHGVKDGKISYEEFIDLIYDKDKRLQGYKKVKLAEDEEDQSEGDIAPSVASSFLKEDDLPYEQTIQYHSLPELNDNIDPNLPDALMTTLRVTELKSGIFKKIHPFREALYKRCQQCSGRLSYNMFRDFVKSVPKLRLSHVEIEGFLSLVDGNQDGFIDSNELNEALFPTLKTSNSIGAISIASQLSQCRPKQSKNKPDIGVVPCLDNARVQTPFQKIRSRDAAKSSLFPSRYAESMRLRSSASMNNISRRSSSPSIGIDFSTFESKVGYVPTRAGMRPSYSTTYLLNRE